MRGFLDIHAERGLEVPDSHLLVPGYSADKVERVLDLQAVHGTMGLFVNSTIALEGVVRWAQTSRAHRDLQLRYGCFDYDPFAALLPGNVGMVQQDIGAMLSAAFDIVEGGDVLAGPTLIPCLLRPGM